jgi:hypothetical protein
MVLTLALLCTLAGGVAAGARSAGASPIKVAAQPPVLSVDAGKPATVQVVLQDADNRPAPAPKDLTVTAEIRQPSGSVWTQALTFRAGASQAPLMLRLAQPGIVRVRLRQTELREGGALINVRRARVAVGRQGGSARPFLPLPRLRRPAPPLPSRAGGFRGRRGAAGTTQKPPDLTLLCGPGRPVLADGKDKATVTAALSRPADRDTEITLASSDGRRVSLSLPKGVDTAYCTLISDRPGRVTLRYLGTPLGAVGGVQFMPAIPGPVAAGGDELLEVDFAPPITGFVIKPSPERVSVLGQAEFVVQLLDERRQPTASDTERPFCLVKDNGEGEITPITLSIPAGGFQSRAVFVPSWLGPVQVTASTPHMLSQTARIQVSLPPAVPCLILLGGLLGGCVAYLTKDRAQRVQRIPIGAVCGAVFYCLCLGLGMGGFAHSFVLSLPGVFVLPILGGWFGTAVLDFLLTKIPGLSPARPAS